MANNTSTNANQNNPTPATLNTKSYHSSKVVVEKKNDSNLQQAGTKIFVEQAKYIKTNVLKTGDTMWRGYGKEFRRLLQIGIDTDRKQHHITYSARLGLPRGDVVVNFKIIRDKLQTWEHRSRNLPYFHIETVRNIVTEALAQNKIHGKVTVEKYYRRVLELSKEHPDWTSQFDVTGFMSHDFTKG